MLCRPEVVFFSVREYQPLIKVSPRIVMSLSMGTMPISKQEASFRATRRYCRGVKTTFVPGNVNVIFGNKERLFVLFKNSS